MAMKSSLSAPRTARAEADVVWKVPSLDPTKASVRIRTMLPALALERRGLRIAITDREPTEQVVRSARAVVINKSFRKDDQKLIDVANRYGTPVILDLCDNIFARRQDGTERPSARAFRYQARGAKAVVTTNDALADIVRSNSGYQGVVEVIPDSVETRDTNLHCMTHTFHRANSPPIVKLRYELRALRHSLVAAMRRRQASARLMDRGDFRSGRSVVVWFGISAGMGALHKVLPELVQVDRAHPIQLLVISEDASMFDEFARKADFPCVFRPWSLRTIHDLIGQATVCILPRADGPYDSAKSANRAVLALSLGVPVVADWIPSLSPLKEAVLIGEWHQAMTSYLNSSELRHSHVTAAADVIAPLYSLDVVADCWQRLLQSMNSPGYKQDGKPSA